MGGDPDLARPLVMLVMPFRATPISMAILLFANIVGMGLGEKCMKSHRFCTMASPVKVWL